MQGPQLFEASGCSSPFLLSFVSSTNVPKSNVQKGLPLAAE